MGGLWQAASLLCDSDVWAHRLDGGRPVVMASEHVSTKLADADSDDDRLPVSLMQLTALAAAADPVAAVRALAKDRSAEAAKLVELQDKTRARRPERAWECESAVEYCAAWHPTRGELWLKVWHPTRGELWLKVWHPTRGELWLRLSCIFCWEGIVPSQL